MLPQFTWGLLNNTDFFKVFLKFNLWFCTVHHESQRPDGVHPITKHSIWDAGGEYFSEAIQYMFAVSKDRSADNANAGEDDVYCEQKLESVSEHQVTVSLLFAIFLSMVCVLLTSLVVCICLRQRRRRTLLIKKLTDCGNTVTDTHEQQFTTVSNSPKSETDEFQMNQNCNEDYRTGKFKGILLVSPNLISLRNVSKDSQSIESEIGWFLKNSVDYVFSELDKYVLDRATPTSPTGNGPGSSIAEYGTSPRMIPRRVTPRSRQGSGSSPMLSPNDRADEPTERRVWQEFQQKVIPLGKFPYHNEAYKNTDKIVNDKVRNLIQFYNAQCIVRFEQWNGACLVANYALCLMEKAMQSLNTDTSTVIFDRFEMTGSIMKGLKSSTAGQFDVHMVFQGSGFKISHTLDQTSSERIPPGKLLLKAEQVHGRPNECLKTIHFDNDNFLCVSSAEIATFSESLLDNGIQKMYTETRSLIDRLPFRIQRSATSPLTLSLDTRNVVGLNLPEIKIQVVPAFPLHAGGWYQLSTVYAVPPWHVQDVKRKVPSKSGGSLQPYSHDLLWSLSLGELEQAFFNGVGNKMETAGVASCHIICLVILKTLFTSVTRRSLLDRGEMNSYILETVLSFLLLESSPSEWTLDKLADRFSDSIHFLRSAMEHGRLPSFFVHNPHLLKQMPALKTYPFLTNGRQENLLAETKQETTEKTLKFMNHRLKEMKMEGCVNNEYSEDMWEYEFFVFN